MRGHRRVCVLGAVGLGLTGALAFGQADTLFWRSEASNGNWAVTENWFRTDPTPTGNFFPNGNDVLRFANNSQLTMNNNLSGGSLNQFRIFFDSNASQARTITGNTLTFFDFGTAAPLIQNDSVANHVINLPIVHGNNSGVFAFDINSNAGDLTFGSSATLTGNGGTRRFFVEPSASRTITFNGAINNGSGTVVFTKEGAGNVVLNASNGYSGGTSVTEGTLTLGHASNTLADSGAVTVSGGTLALGSNSDTVGAVTLTSGSITGTGTLSGSSYAVEAGTVGAVLGGSGALTKSNAGSVSLNNSNTYSGGTTVNNGTLTLGHASNTLADGGAVTVSGGTLALGSNSDTVGAVTLTSGSITGTGTLSGSSYAVSSGSVSAKLGGSGSLTKSTGATVTLSGANTYTGNTTVAAGTLSLATTGSIDNSPVIDVQSGATLDVSSVASYSVKVGQTLKGNGTVVGSTTVNGTLAPGASAGKLTLSGGNLVLASSATTEMEISGTTRGTVGGYDAVDVGGALVYDGALSIPVSGTYVDGTSFNLFDFASQSDNFDSITLSGSYAGALTYGGAGTWSNTISGMVFTFTNSTGVLSLSAQAIPEPLTAAGVILLGSRVLGRRSRASL